MSTWRIEVHALAPSLYVVFRVAGEHREPLADSAGSGRFPSRAAALDHLRDAGVDEVDVVHFSAYGEMVGVAGSARDTEFRETVRLAPQPRSG